MTDLWDRVESLPPAERQAFTSWAMQEVTRCRAVRRHKGPADLAAELDPTMVRTPAVELVSAEMETAITTPGSRKIITMPPQEGKTTLAIHAAVRALQHNPDTRVLYLSYSEELAVRSSSEARDILARFGTDAKDPLTGLPMADQLGLSLSADKAAAGSWRVKGRKGGMIGVGIGGTITGRPADLIIIDDPIKGLAAADSKAERAKVIAGWKANIQTRLSPNASVIIINTRWHEEDLTGFLLTLDGERAPDDREWQLLNIPAIAEAGIPDALGRPHGEPMVSARGHRDWAKIRANVGERVWYALYQGSPYPAGGALFSAKWFDTYRLDSTPALYRRIVGIDPAETGKGDEAGIIAAGLAGDGTVVLTEDWSGALSSAEWPRRALLLALSTAASEVHFEAYNAPKTYGDLLFNAYMDLVAEATRLTADLPEDQRARFAADGTAGVVDGIRVPMSRPFAIYPWKGSGDALARSVGLRNATSVGRCRVVGLRLATMEARATRWQEGQHQPDRVAGCTIAYDVLAPTQPAVITGGAASWGSMPSGI